MAGKKGRTSILSEEDSKDPHARATGEGERSPGGIKIDEEELKAAFDFFDVNGKGRITPADLKARLSAFYKNLPVREYKFLISESDFTLKTLTKLLADNELANFDPVKEAFKLYDPQETGFVDIDVLKNIFSNLGYGEITEEDMAVLVECADVDGDGKISLEDFRDMIRFNKQRVNAGPPGQNVPQRTGGTPATVKNTSTNL